ncbi:MAG: PEP-CTERM sorting domain-containing protein [Pseudomonadota bacterium]|nr:PEP-CTERM sorting domain-containing protein [Pseudomonadota bacterium]
MLLFSASAYAIPILQVNLTGATGGVYFSKYNDNSIDHAEADRTLIALGPLWNGNIWNGNIDESNVLNGSYANGFTLPYGLSSAFATQLLGPDFTGIAILDIFPVDVTQIDGAIVSTDDADEVTDFFATLGIAMADWQATEEGSYAAGQQEPSAPGPFIPAITWQDKKNECLQRYYGPLQKSGLRENSCPEAGGMAGGAGGSGSGSGSGGVGSRGSIGAVADRVGSGPGNVGPGLGNVASGIGGGGPGGPGIGGGDPIGPGGSGIGNGDGVDSGGGNGDIGEVRTVPEPTTLALLGFGIAGMCTARRRKK